MKHEQQTEQRRNTTETNLAEAVAKDQTAPPSGEDGKAELPSFGRFKTGEELWEAYRLLEAEFTRRSQKLKTLEEVASKQNEQSKWAERVEALTATYPIAAEYGEEIGQFLKEKDASFLDGDDCLEKALLHILATKAPTPKKEEEVCTAPAAVPLTKEQIVQEYLNGRDVQTPKIHVDGGEIPTVLPIKPKTIGEAGALAKSMMKPKND